MTLTNKRLLAGILDFTLVSILVLLVTYFISAILGPIEITEEMILDLSYYNYDLVKEIVVHYVIGYIFTIITVVSYYVIIPHMFDGSTFFKLLFKIKVIDIETMGKVSILRSFFRAREIHFFSILFVWSFWYYCLPISQFTRATSISLFNGISESFIIACTVFVPLSIVTVSFMSHNRSKKDEVYSTDIVRITQNKKA